MEMTLTIEEFHKLLTSEQNESPLLSALRKLTGFDEPEEITRPAAEPLLHWAGWSGG